MAGTRPAAGVFVSVPFHSGTGVAAQAGLGTRFQTAAVWVMSRAAKAEWVRYSPAKGGRLVTATCREMEMRGPSYRGTVFSTVHLGGGASCLSLDQLYRLLECLYDNLCIEPVEQTMAVQPGTLDAGKVKVIRESGFDRVELWTEDPDHDRADFGLLASAGFGSAGIRLAILREPGEWERRLDAVLALAPDCITCRLGGPYEKLALLAMLRRTRDRLGDRYHEWAPLAYVQPGKEPTPCDAVAGFGPGALSTVTGGATVNRPDFGGYVRAAAAGEAVTQPAGRAVLVGFALSGQQGLAATGVQPERELVAGGLLARRGTRLHLTDQGTVARERVIARLSQGD